jgi:hypothetical protein
VFNHGFEIFRSYRDDFKIYYFKKMAYHGESTEGACGIGKERATGTVIVVQPAYETRRTGMRVIRSNKCNLKNFINCFTPYASK